MTFDEIPNGTRVFIDANIFIYHFGGQSVECQTLLERCARQEVLGYTSTFVIATMLEMEISDLVSADQGFTRVNGIRVYAPQDL